MYFFFPQHKKIVKVRSQSFFICHIRTICSTCGGMKLCTQGPSSLQQNYQSYRKAVVRSLNNSGTNMSLCEQASADGEQLKGISLFCLNCCLRGGCLVGYCLTPSRNGLWVEVLVSRRGCDVGIRNIFIV